MVAMLAAFVFSGSNGMTLFLNQEIIVDSQQLVGEDPEQDDERPMAYLDYACNALAPAAQFLVSHQPAFEAPLPPLADIPEKPLSIPALRVDAYFLTLFRIIISPNAP